MKRCTTDVCSITLPLKAEKWQKDRLDKRFELGRKLYNTLLGQELKKYRRLAQTSEFFEICREMDSLFEAQEKGSARYRELSDKRTALLKAAEFTEFGFYKAMRPLYKSFRKNIDSNMAQAIARDVWKSFQRYLYGDGKWVHFKMPGQFHVLSGVRSRSSIRFFGDKIWFNGLVIPVKRDPNNLYEKETLTYKIKFNRIMRKRVGSKYQYYVQLVLEGKPAVKRDLKTSEIKYPLGKGSVGLYVGTASFAYVTDTAFGRTQLAPPTFDTWHKERLRQKMAKSLCGFGRSGRPRRYEKLRDRFRDCCRREAESRKIYQGYLTNRMLELGDIFYVNKTDFAKLARRPGKNGTSRKQKGLAGCGRQIQMGAPATLLRLLDRKIQNQGGAGLKWVQKNLVTEGARDAGLPNELYGAFLLKQLCDERNAA